MPGLIPYYQSIPELGIKGRMNTEIEFNNIGMPEDLNGWSVLDIGSNMGAFCIRAWKCGAEEIHGVEPEMEWRVIASGIQAELERKKGLIIPIAYVPSLEEAPPTADLVLLLSITHLIPAAQAQKLFNEAWSRTNKLMILEVNDRLQEMPLVIPKEFKIYGKNKDNRTVYHGVKNNV